MTIPTTTQPLHLPQFLFNYWKPKKIAEQKTTEAVVLALLSEGKITSGKGAELLGISRWEFMELMSQHNLPMADFNSDELKKQVKDFKKLSK